MKSAIKQIAFTLLGETRARSIWRTLRNRPPRFSEAALIEAWFDANPRTGVMVDVGAHFGESLMPYVQRGWKVYAFEPDPDNRRQLLQRIKPEQITLHDCAVSDHEDDGVPFFASPESDGISGLSAFRETHRQVTKVRLTTLDRVLSEENEKRVDLLKVDTEGHDYFVLRGFPWARITPDVVLCEFEDAKTKPLGYDYKTLGEFLISKGYQVFLSEWKPIVKYGADHSWLRWKEYPCALDNPNGWGNYVAFRGGVPTAAAAEYVAKFSR